MKSNDIQFEELHYKVKKEKGKVVRAYLKMIVILLVLVESIVTNPNFLQTKEK